MIVSWRILLLVLSSLINSNKAEVFSSVHHLESLARSERKAIDILRKFPERNILIDGLIEEYESIPRVWSNDQEMAKNPITSFHMMKRVKEMLKIRDLIDETTWKELQSTFKNGSLFPTEADMDGAEFGIVLLAKIYSLDLIELSQGKINDYKTNLTMKVQDFVGFFKRSSQLRLVNQSMEWFRMILMEISTKKDVNPEIIDTIISSLRESFLWTTQASSQSISQMNQISALLRSNRKFIDLCNGQTPSQANSKGIKKLFCYYSTRKSYWLFIQPLKVEMLHPNEPLIMFHDILTNTETELIKKMSAENIGRSFVGKNKNSSKTLGRTCMSTSLSIRDHEVIKRIARRISHATGLSLNEHPGDSEPLAIINYGLGGWYGPHFDSKPGDRKATVMFWLSDVEMGGATVFPNLDLAVFPKRNSAIFWYNLDGHGKVLKSSYHGACPVLVGNKWVATFWIKEIGQIWSS